MEGMNNAKMVQGLPPRWPKRQTGSLPSANSSFQEWTKPYFMNYNGSSKPHYPPSDAKTTHSPLVNDDNRTTQNPPPPSDKNPIPNGDNSVKTTGYSQTAGLHTRCPRNMEHNMDPRKLRRIMSNRVSAQKSRMKKLQYVTDMERKAKALETQIAELHPQVALYKNKQVFLEREQQSLNHRMITYTNNSIITNAEIEENKAEVSRLRQLHLTQMQEQKMLPVWESGMEEMMSPNLCRTGLGQMVYTNPNQQGQYMDNTEEMLREKQLQMKQVAAQCVDENAETNRLDPLIMNQQQQNPRHDMLMMPAGWETVGQMPNPSFKFQPGPPQKADIINTKLGGIEQILCLNNNNNVSQDPRNGFK